MLHQEYTTTEETDASNINSLQLSLALLAVRAQEKFAIAEDVRQERRISKRFLSRVQEVYMNDYVQVGRLSLMLARINHFTNND